MWPYCCSVVILFLSNIVPCLALGMLKLFGLLHLPLANAMLLLVVLLISGVCLTAELISALIGYKLLGMINYAIEWDKLGGNSGPVLNVVAATFGLYPYLASAFLLLSEMDPIFQFLQFTTQNWTSIANFPVLKFLTLTILRPILTLISMLQICRFFAIFFCGSAVGCTSLVDNITQMDRISNRFWIQSYAREILRSHAAIQILLHWSSAVLNSLVAIFQFAGFISVPFNYMTLKMYNLVPFRLYVAFPVVCILLPMSHQILLPILISVYEGEVNLHKKWRRSLCFCGDTRYLMRRVKATKILRVYCGLSDFNFYFLKKSTKLKYQYTILSYTISALLSGKG
ncbi:hypothetical protein Fcan01_10114 [Folsomia candida]|uniref:Uncharacterized protein n=1 Tax=Folsomia candida TaxID=158441 RepID=A0A226EBR9_FOLCA|nr:hypothetical protein Fcan01_10114 [Folsomia candida]